MTSSAVIPLICAISWATYGRFREEFRFPRLGTGASYGESVSSKMEDRGTASAVSFNFRAFLNVTTPPIPI